MAQRPNKKSIGINLKPLLLVRNYGEISRGGGLANLSPQNKRTLIVNCQEVSAFATSVLSREHYLLQLAIFPPLPKKSSLLLDNVFISKDVVFPVRRDLVVPVFKLTVVILF